MRILLIISTLALLQGCAHNDPWTKRDTVLQAIYTGTLVVDAIQTADIQYRPDLVEAGPVARTILGLNPSTSDTWMYFGTLAISNYFITRALPEKWRPFWQGANIAVHTNAIFNNCDLGLGKICEERSE